MPNQFKAHLALFAVALIYGANYTIAKLVMDDGYLQPLAFILLRVSSAALLFWIAHTLFVRESVQRADWGLIFLCALCGVAINQMFFFSGLKLTTPIHASLIMTTTPIVVLLTSALLLREQITQRKVMGIAVGAVGAILLIVYGKDISSGGQQWQGDMLIFVNTVSYGIYLVLVKKLMLKYHLLTVVKWVFLLGFVMVFPFGITDLSATDWSTFTTGIWLSVVYVLLFTTFFAFLLNAYALTVVPASVVGTYVYLQPLLATLVALLAGQDQLSWLKIGSGLLIFIGVYLTSVAKKQVVAEEI